MSYTDNLVHELLDAMVRRWIDEHIDVEKMNRAAELIGYLDMF